MLVSGKFNGRTSEKTNDWEHLKIFNYCKIDLPPPARIESVAMLCQMNAATESSYVIYF